MFTRSVPVGKKLKLLGQCTFQEMKVPVLGTSACLSYTLRIIFFNIKEKSLYWQGVTFICVISVTKFMTKLFITGNSFKAILKVFLYYKMEWKLGEMTTISLIDIA